MGSYRHQSLTNPRGPFTNPRGPKKLKNSFFHKNLFFDNFKWYLGGLGVSGGMAWTIRCDSLELWRGLVLHGMGEVDFHVFWKYWKLTSSPNTSKLVFGPPDWSSDFFESQGTIAGAIKPISFPKNDPPPKKGNWATSPNRHVFTKWLSFYVFFVPNAFFWAPWGPGPQGYRRLLNAYNESETHQPRRQRRRGTN